MYHPSKVGAVGGDTGGVALCPTDALGLLNAGKVPIIVKFCPTGLLSPVPEKCDVYVMFMFINKRW